MRVLPLLIAFACDSTAVGAELPATPHQATVLTSLAVGCSPAHAPPVAAQHARLRTVHDAESSGTINSEEAARARSVIASLVLDDMLRRAPCAKLEADSLARRLAAPIDARVVTTPVKGRPRALEKILSDYNGDATRIKDLARNTIVVREDQVCTLVDRFIEYGARIKIINPLTDPLGYSGINATFMTASGVTAETQITTPLMIYAKLRPEKARAILGLAQYGRIMRKTGRPSGRGRALYEQWRSLAASSHEAVEIASESRAYYRPFLPKNQAGGVSMSRSCSG